MKGSVMKSIALPAPALVGELSVEAAIAQRRSRRRLLQDALSAEHLSQLLWCAQGVTDERRKRAAPSAGAVYPIELMVVVGDATAGELSAGVYRYDPAEHAVACTRQGDVRVELSEACHGQTFVATAPMVLVMAAEMLRISKRYGDRAWRYVNMEAGHIGENVHLQAESLGLGTVAVGAFEDDAVSAALDLSEKLVPLYLMPAGRL
jgi:SagB-type dehydrogenase family enzyme